MNDTSDATSLFQIECFCFIICISHSILHAQQKTTDKIHMLDLYELFSFKQLAEELTRVNLTTSSIIDHIAKMRAQSSSYGVKSRCTLEMFAGILIFGFNHTLHLGDDDCTGWRSSNYFIGSYQQILVRAVLGLF